MKEIIKLGITLFLITAISTGIVAFSYEITKGPIEIGEKIKNDEALKLVLNEAKNYEEVDFDLEEGSNIKAIYAGYVDNNIIGYVVKVSSKGFGGPIEMMVGVSGDGLLKGIKILKHSETPGLGDHANKPEFSNQYMDKSIENSLEVVKREASSDNEIQAISGATITSKAVTAGVNEVIEFIKKNFSKI